MKATFLVAFVCYSLCILGTAALAVIYLVRPKFMPYHEEAVGLSWQQLDQRMQVLLLSLMRAVAGGMLGGCVSIAFLLIIPFRAGASWAYYAIPLIGLVTGLPSLYGMVLVRSRTKAHTPIAVSAACIGLIVIGIIFSLV